MKASLILILLFNKFSVWFTLPTHDSGSTLLNAPVSFHCLPESISPRNKKNKEDNNHYRYNIKGHMTDIFHISLIENDRLEQNLEPDNISKYYNNKCNSKARTEVDKSHESQGYCRNVEYNTSVFTSTVYTEVILIHWA